MIPNYLLSLEERVKTKSMKVYVNEKPVDILPGMKVKHALINAGLLKEIDSGKRVYDEWGNEVGLDGGLSEGINIYVRAKKGG